MRIEDLKRWHWIVAGLLAGLALSYLYASVEPGTGATMAQQRFEQFVTNRPFQDEHPWLRDVTVYPPRQGVTIVTGRYLEVGRNQTAAYKPFRYMSSTPYQPMQRLRGNRPPDWDQLEQQTVREYLEYHAAQRDELSFNYAWTREPRFIYLIWTTGALVIIGGIWPTVVNVLTGAGFGRRSEPKPEYDLDRFTGGEEPDLQPQKKVVTQEDIDQLAAVEAELERKLAAQSSDDVSPPPPEDGQAEQPVRQLDGRPAEHGPTREQTEEEKAYGGEFYPTVAHAAKKKDE